MSSLIVPRSWFEQWREPQDFFLKTDNCMEQFEPDVILGMPGVQHLFDAYVGGFFARIWNDHKPCKVCLVKDSFPDAQLRDADCTLDLEITMADKKDRKMAAEHRRLRELREKGELAAEPTDYEKDREYALEAVPRVCEQKVRKYLGSPASDRRVQANLLIYVNFSTLAGFVLSDNEMADLTERWRCNFLSIWLLCGARLFRPWPTRVALSATSNPLD